MPGFPSSGFLGKNREESVKHLQRAAASKCKIFCRASQEYTLIYCSSPPHTDDRCSPFSELVNRTFERLCREGCLSLPLVFEASGVVRFQADFMMKLAQPPDIGSTIVYGRFF